MADTSPTVRDMVLAFANTIGKTEADIEAVFDASFSAYNPAPAAGTRFYVIFTDESFARIDVAQGSA